MKQRIKFTTFSGSTYIIDQETMRWYRQSDHGIIGDPGDYYTGRLRVWPDIRVDERARIVDVASNEGISTSYVTSITRTGVELP